MSERLPRSTHPAEIARQAAARAAGARAIAAIAEPPRPTVAEKAARLSARYLTTEGTKGTKGDRTAGRDNLDGSVSVCSVSSVVKGPRRPLGPSGGGPSIEAVRGEVEAEREVVRAAVREEVRSIFDAMDNRYLAGLPSAPEPTVPARKRRRSAPQPQLRLPGLDGPAAGPYGRGS